MGLEVSPDRPLTRLVVRAITGHDPCGGLRRGPYAPPIVATAPDTGERVDASGVEALSRWILRSLLLGADPVAGLAEEVAPDAVAWSPALFAATREAVLDLLGDVDAGASPLSEVSVVVNHVDVVPPRVYLEWRLEGRFTQPCFVEDDLLVEPTGRLVETAGVLVVTFRDDRVRALHCYYDDLALLEQLLTVP